jgi:CHAT domain-containing protein/tetratricopeptide (TPR) repeat protein
LSDTGSRHRWLPLALIAGVCIGTDSPAQSQVLEPHRTVQAELGAGRAHKYAIELRAGDYAHILVQQRTVDVAVVCVGPAGEQLFTIDSHVIGDAESVQVTAELPGVYEVRITPSERNAPIGRYEITFDDTGRATERHKLRMSGVRASTAAVNARRLGTREAFVQAIGLLEQALEDWRAAQAHIEEATTLFTIGLLYIETGDRRRALEYTTQALAVAQSTLDRKVRGRALEAIARVHNSFGDKRKAIEYCEMALPLLRAVHDRSGEGNALDNLGVAYSGTGEKRKALASFDQAIQIFGALQDRRLLAELAGNIGVTYDNLGEYRRALENHERSLMLVRELGDRGAEAVTQNNIGLAWSGLGEYQKALDAYSTALELNRLFDNRWNMAINLNNIAWVYGQMGNQGRALRLYRRSLDLFRNAKDQRRIASVLNNIGDIYTELGEYRKAARTHREALSFRRAAGDRDGEANSLNNLGRCYTRSGQWQAARDYFQRAVAILRNSGNRYMLARALRNLGVLDRESGDAEHARSFLEEALEISRLIRDPRGKAEALGELAKVERDRGDLAGALQRTDEALTAFESVRLGVMSPALRASFVARVRDIHELRIELLMGLHARQPGRGFGAAALLASEHARARSLLEMLRESGAAIRHLLDPVLVTRERELIHLISARADLQTRLLSGKHSGAEADALEKDLDGLMLELEQVQSRIRASSPQYAALTQPTTLDVKALQTRVLDEDTVLLEYAVGRRKSFLWVVSQTSMDVFELPGRSQIESVAKRVYSLLTARNERRAGETPAARSARLRQADQAYLAEARKASRMLLDPAAARIGKKRLLIIREGALQYLPFGSLPEPGTNTPLIMNHEIVTAPSASVLAVVRQEAAGRKPAEKGIAVLADPVFNADDARIPSPGRTVRRAGFEHGAPDFVRLRFSRTEAEEITRLAGARAVHTALDFEASRDAAMNPHLAQYRMVHFATHTLLNDEHPDLSGVVLSLVDQSGNPQNGFLRLHDIYSLRLRADLVVLSACRTALGQEIKGEGLIGLTRAFLYAGAPRVVATLWDIDDRAAAEMMKRFYERMLVRAERPAQALRAAQIAMRNTKGWQAPYYWAAFTLEGEWR